MTPALRKRHQRIWWFLGLALLLIWGTSMVAIHKNNSFQTPIANSTTKGVIAQVISKNSADNQLIKLTLGYPSNFVRT